MTWEIEGIEPSGELGEDNSEAPIDNGIFSYLNLIKLNKLNYEVRILPIIIAIIKMFRMPMTIISRAGNINVSISNIFRYILQFSEIIL